MEMQILFDNAWAQYAPGSKVAGRLVLNLNSPKQVREIKIKFKGEAQVKWTEESWNNSEGKRETHNNVDYTADETYFENEFNVAGECELPAGTHNYDFSTILPPNLPSSYEGEHGHIRYTVKAVLDILWTFDQGEVEAAFTVISHVDLNHSEEAKMPVTSYKEKTAGMWCCAQGPLSATMTAPYAGYTSGQTIPISVEIENGTNINVTPGYVVFRKVVTYKSQHPSQEVKIEKTDIVKVGLGAVGAHGTDVQSKSITIPSLPATTIGCSIISIGYEVMAKIPLAGICLRGIKLEAPVILGTVPLMSAAPASSGSDPAQGPGQTGWASGSDMKALYPNLPLQSYEESAFGKADTIQDKDDNEHTMGVGGWVNLAI